MSAGWKSETDKLEMKKKTLSFSIDETKGLLLLILVAHLTLLCVGAETEGSFNFIAASFLVHSLI